jgi:hypothetical protein
MPSERGMTSCLNNPRCAHHTQAGEEIVELLSVLNLDIVRIVSTVRPVPMRSGRL